MHDAGVNLMGTLNVLECAIKVEARKVDLRRQRRHDLRRAEAPARQGIAPPRAPSRSAPTASRRRRCSTTWASTSAIAGWTSPRARSPTSTGRDRTRYGEAGVIAIFASSMLAGKVPTIYGDGNQTRDFVFIDDVVHAFVQAMDRGSGKLVNIGTGLETSVRGLYELLAQIIGFERGAGARGVAARGAPPDRAGHLGRGQGARVEAVDAPRGRPRRDRRLPEGDLMADMASPVDRASPASSSRARRRVREGAPPAGRERRASWSTTSWCGPRATGTPTSRRKRPHDAHDAVPHRLDHEDVHRDGDPAAPRRREAAPRRPGGRVPPGAPRRARARSAPIETVTIRRMLSHESGLMGDPPGTRWFHDIYEPSPRSNLAQGRRDRDAHPAERAAEVLEHRLPAARRDRRAPRRHARTPDASRSGSSSRSA